MVTFANLGSVVYQVWSSSAFAFGRYGVFSACQLSIYYNHNNANRRHCYVHWASFFVCPGDAPVAITQNLAWMERQFSACQTLRSMYPSIFNIFPVILTASAKIAVFTYRRPHFCFPWRRLCDYHAIMLHARKENSMLAKPLAACTYLSSIVSELYDA